MRKETSVCECPGQKGEAKATSKQGKHVHTHAQWARSFDDSGGGYEREGEVARRMYW